MLVSHIDGTAVLPPRLDADGSPNPAYNEWFAIDRLLVGFLRGAMTQDVGANLMHCRTAKDLWDGARALTCANIKSRVMVFKQELHKARKQGMKMVDYLGKMKNLADQLQLAGAPVPMEDLIMHTLTGLDADYNSVVWGLNRVPNLTWIVLQSELLACESRLEQLAQESNLGVPPSAHVAQKEKDGSDSSRGSSDRGNWRGARGGFRSGRRGGSRGRRGNYQNNYNHYGGNSNSNRPYCHLCEKFGHTVVNCFHRFDRSFQPPSHQNSYSNFQPQAMYASPQVVHDPSWYFDSGASHHVASHPAQLDNYTPGNMSLFTCTGDRTPVTGIGTAKLKTSHADLVLKNVLVVPAATKNLLSIQKLTQDNPVAVHFTDSVCVVKDKMTNQSLVQGIPNQGMYQMAKGSPAQVCVAQKREDQSFLQWHYKLGHPSDRIVKQVLNQCNLNFQCSKTICEACQCGKSKFLPFPRSLSHAKAPLDLIHTDLW